MKERNRLSLLGKIVAANLALMLLYTTTSIGISNMKGEGIVIGGIITAYHAIALFVISMILFIIKKNDWGKNLLLSALVVFLVGFSICVGALVTMPH